jgi:glycosyltransferase involved in cell wall biosynthesis
MAEPVISVVMPVHNAQPFLQASIDSILSQTFPDFEFVILNDGSTDGSAEVLRECERRDSRIRVYESNFCQGLAGSSNFVVRKARAPLIARMDADDICEPERLRRQWEVLRDNVDVGLVGSLCDGIDAAGRRIRSRDRWRIMRSSRYPPFPHGSAMFRRSVFESVGGYRLEYERHEDIDLFTRILQRARVVTLPEVLYHFRFHHTNTSSTSTTDAQHSEKLADLYLQGAMRLWSGQAPGILREVIRTRSGRLNYQKLMIMAWAAWADLHPRSLLLFVRGWVRVRDRFASLRVKDGRFYEWRCR